MTISVGWFYLIPLAMFLGIVIGNWNNQPRRGDVNWFDDPAEQDVLFKCAVFVVIFSTVCAINAFIFGL